MCPSNEVERKETSRVPYASTVGSLIFAMICRRPDIEQVVGVVSNVKISVSSRYSNFEYQIQNSKYSKFKYQTLNFEF